jgi:hypothetical protein
VGGGLGVGVAVGVAVAVGVGVGVAVGVGPPRRAEDRRSERTTASGECETDWGAHSSRVLVIAFCDHELFHRIDIDFATESNGKFVTAECGDQHAVGTIS